MFLGIRRQFPGSKSQLPPGIASACMNRKTYRSISPSDFVELFSLLVVDSSLNAAKVPIVIVEHDRWYFKVAHQTIV